MAVFIHLPALLRASAGNRSVIAVEANSLRGMVEYLRIVEPRLYAHLFDETGVRRPHIALFVNSENVTASIGGDPPLLDGDEVHVLPAVSGG